MLIGLAPRLRSFTDAEEVNQLQQEAVTELQQPGRWGTTPTVIQSWGQRTTSVPSAP